MTQCRVFRSTVSTVSHQCLHHPCSRERAYLPTISHRQVPLGSCRWLRRSICAAVRQQRPGHARHLIGECHRDDLEGSAGQEAREPEIFLRVLHGATQDGMRADDENTSQIAVALLGDRSKLLLAPGRILSRHQPNPSRKIASRPKNRRVCHSRRDRGRPDDADARDGLKPLARLVRAVLRLDSFLDRSDQRLHWPEAAPPAQ